MTERDPDALVLDPPHRVFADAQGKPAEVPAQGLDELAPNEVAYIRNPWRMSEFVRGVVRGEPGALVLDLGSSVGVLERDGLGWFCRGLVKRERLFSELAQEKASETQELMSRVLRDKTSP